MALEEQLASHQKALEANTAAVTALLKHMQGGKGAAPAADKGKGETAPTADKGKGAKLDKKAVVAIAMRIKEEISEDSAKNFIAKHTGGGTLKDLAEKDYAKFYKAAEAALESGEEIEGEDDESGGL